MKIYIKNLCYILLGCMVIAACAFIPTIPPLWAGYAIFVALVFIARGLGKIINEFFISRYLKKRTKNTQNPVRDIAVRNKAVTITLIITLTILTVVAVKPAFFGSPSNDVIFFLAVFFWHIINIPVHMYYDKNYIMKIKTL